MPPGEFIPIAEELGLIEAIGDWVIDELAHQHKWETQGLEVRVGFNLSPRQLWSGRLAEKLMEKLSAAEVDPTTWSWRSQVDGDGRSRPHAARPVRCCTPGASRWRSTTSGPARRSLA